jgi:hypothetical protein
MTFKEIKELALIAVESNIGPVKIDSIDFVPDCDTLEYKVYSALNEKDAVLGKMYELLVEVGGIRLF